MQISTVAVVVALAILVVALAAYFAILIVSEVLAVLFEMLMGNRK